MNGIMDV